MKKQVLLVDADEQFRTKLEEALNACDEFEVVGIAADGEEAIRLLKAKAIDILVLDLLLPKYDGLTVLQLIPDMCIVPQILVTTAFISNYVAISAMHLGAQQLIHKPCDAYVIIRNLYRMMADRNYGPAVFLWNDEKTVESLVTRMLHEIGVPAHIKGYQYVREAIILAANDEDESNALLKCRYDEVAKVFNTTAKKVASAIRHAIEVAWDRGDWHTLQRFFGYTASNIKGKPTNTEFISIIADRIRLWMKENAGQLE